jgi:hypothetical protein
VATIAANVGGETLVTLNQAFDNSGVDRRMERILLQADGEVLQRLSTGVLRSRFTANGDVG